MYYYCCCCTRWQGQNVSLVTLNLPACRQGLQFLTTLVCVFTCLCVWVYGAAINTHANVLPPPTTTTTLPTIEVGWFVWGIPDSQLTSVGRVLHPTNWAENYHHHQVTLARLYEGRTASYIEPVARCRRRCRCCRAGLFLFWFLSTHTHTHAHTSNYSLKHVQREMLVRARILGTKERNEMK